MSRSWTETQALAERAARGAGVPFAQAARFAVGVARHLADNRPSDDILHAYENPDLISDIALDAERVTEAASVSGKAWTGHSAAPELLKSVIEALPCDSAVSIDGTQVHARLILDEPSQKSRPARLFVPHALQTEMERLAQRTYVPDSAASREAGAGAGLMELD